MAKCEICGSELSLPFVCSYCGGTFCYYHRLPEAHNCKMLHLVKTQRPTLVYSPPPKSRFRIPRVTSRTEIAHLLIAWIVLSACFSTRYIFGLSPMLPLIFSIYLLVVGTGFVSHELAHKFTAQKNGCWSEFRLWPWGLMVALLSSLLSLGSFIFAAPGATYVIPRYHAYGYSEASERKRMGLISLAGPLSNVVWAILFFILSRMSGLLNLVGSMGFRVNLWLAAFNMIPLGDLDGRKILSWSIIVWVIVAVPLWALELFLMLFKSCFKNSMHFQNADPRILLTIALEDNIKNTSMVAAAANR